MKRDRAEVVSRVVPHVAMELYRSDEVGEVIGRLVNAAIFYGTCTALEEVAKTKKPVVLSEVSYYRPNSEREFYEAGDAFISTKYPYLSEVTKDPLASIEELLAKKPMKIQSSSSTRKSNSALP